MATKTRRHYARWVPAARAASARGIGVEPAPASGRVVDRGRTVRGVSGMRR
jgi:hypothetical protein